MLLTWLLLTLASIPAPQAHAFLYVDRSTDPIIVVWPPEGLALPPSEGEFILGSVSDPKAPFKINEQLITVHPNGAFLAWLPVSPGTFTFQCSLELKEATATYKRSILVPTPPVSLPEAPLAIDADSLFPKTDLELRPGDWLLVRMKGSPRHPGKFRLHKLPWQPLRETSPGSGTYEGTYLVQPNDNLSPAPVEFELGSGWKSKSAKTQAKVTLSSSPPPIAALRSNGAYVKTGPGNGYQMFPSSGTRFITAGKNGVETKVFLTPSLSGWVDTKELELLPPGTYPPRAVAGSINTAAAKDWTSVKIGLTERVPFSIEESDDLNSLTLRLFYTVGHTNWIVYDSADDFVEQIRWKQEASNVVAVTVRLAPEQSLWGYQASFEGSSLRLDLRQAPKLAAAPLSGRTIFLDPGHMPSASGATGPMGTKEMDANFAIAKAVEARLIKEGAYPVLSRDTTSHEVSLIERPRLAAEKKADLFVSLHNNALSDGENPFARPRGFSVFYYHPHSLALAREMYRSYEKRIPLPGEELRYGNLLVSRMTAMPAILVESAYMILPGHEEKLNDPAFRDQLAQAVVEGLRSFLEKERAKQQRRRP